MPITIESISRRRFLKYTIAGAAGLMVSRLHADSIRPCDPYRFALLSDTHINADPAVIDKECNMSERFAQVIKQVLKEPTLPAHAFLNGDCSHKTGEAGDYTQLLNITNSLISSGVPLSCALGNHDNREVFFRSISKTVSGGSSRLIDDRQVLLLKTPRANWLILDSLQKTSVTPGRLGKSQMEIIEKTLNDPTVSDKPVLILMHHNPEPTVDPATTQPAKGVIGLLDTQLLYDQIKTRKCVKAIFYGHTHKWEQKEYEGIHLINLPAIGYPFDKAQPTGWIDFYLDEKGARAKLMTIDESDSRNRNEFSLAWR